MPTRYSRRAASFTASGWYGRHWFARAIFLKAMDALIEMGVIDSLLGFDDRRNNKKAWQSRYWATDFLKSKFDEFLGSQIVERLQPDKSIVLRDDDKNDISLEKIDACEFNLSNDDYLKIEERICTYNNFAEKQETLLFLDNVIVTYDFLLKLGLWNSKGMVSIYNVSSYKDIYLKYIYPNSIIINNRDIPYINNNTNNNILNKYKCKTYPLLEQLSNDGHLKCIDHFNIPRNKHKKTITIKNLFVHIKWNYAKRVFNNSSFSEGGRFYGNVIQSLPNRSRKIKITPLRGKLIINGKETVELDYKSIHPSILYNKFLNTTYEGDLYEGFSDRNIVKYAFLTILNSKDVNGNKNKTIKGIRKKLFDEGCFPDEGLTDEYLLGVIEFIENKHPQIKPWIGSGIGIQLMRIDSDIASDVMENLRLKNIFASPVHDSFIVEKQYEEALKKEMEECYFKHVGRYPNIDKK